MIDRHDNADPGRLAGLEVILAKAGRHVDNAGAILIDDKIRDMIHDGAGEHELAKHARTQTPVCDMRSNDWLQGAWLRREQRLHLNTL